MTWTAPATFVAGSVLTAAQLNIQLRDNMRAIGNSWTAFTPTLANVTLGTGGSNTAVYLSAGKLTIVRGTITLGTGGSLSGVATMTYPFTSANTGFGAVGSAVFDDTSAGASARRTGTVYSTGATVAQFSLGDNPAGSTNVSSTIPFTWAAGDTIAYTYIYEAA